jgi:exodeoxyribonuclease VII small subunit
MKKKLTYTQAMDRLQAIVASLENNTLGIDELTLRLEEAQQLANFCKQQLTQTTNDIETLFQNNEQK